MVDAGGSHTHDGQATAHLLKALATAEHHFGNAQYQEAETICRRLLKVHPNFAGAHSLFGCVLIQSGKFNSATRHLRRAIELEPHTASLHVNLANGHIRMGQRRLALEASRRAVELAPTFAPARHNLAIALFDLGRYEDALIHFNCLIELTPDDALARLGRSLILLALGNFTEGFPEYEWRLRSAWSAAPPLQRPWRGENVVTKHLRVRVEQGLGDTIQFSRYLPWLLKRAAKVSLEVDRSLVSLLRESFPEIEIFESGGASTARYDYDLHVTSLPGIFKTRVESIPASSSYLRAPQDALARWREKLAQMPGLKVGLVWAGNPQHRLDRFRSLDVLHLAEFLEPLLRIPGVSFASLQLGSRATDLLQVKNGSLRKIKDLSVELGDFGDTAGAIANLDLVISIDSAPAHLAGALGRPVWTLLSFPADWRWLLDRSDTAWYPSMRLFRQRERENWGDVTQRVVAALKEAIADPSLLTPFRAEGERRAAVAHAILERETELAKNDSTSPPITINDLFYLAEQDFLQGQLRKAKELCERGLLYDKVKGPTPHDADFIHLMGLIAHHAGKTQAAITRINRAIALKPDVALYHANLGELYRLYGRPAEAITFCRRAVELAPGHAAARNNLGIALLDQGQCEEALVHFDYAVALQKNYAQAHVNRGNALRRCGRQADAERAYQKAMVLMQSEAAGQAKHAQA